MHVGFLQCRKQLIVPAGVLFFHETVGLAGDRGELLIGQESIGIHISHLGLDLLEHARDTDLEELVEIAGHDGQELDPLEERVPRVSSLLEHAMVESEPGDLAICVELRVSQVHG